MIKVRLQIGSGGVLDTEQAYGFIYLDSDKRVGAPSRGFESTSYPEEDGEHIIPKAVDAAFDYKVKFFVQGTTLENANAKISAFNASLYDYVLDEDDEPTPVKQYKQVTFYNDYKRHKIVGYPSEIAEALFIAPSTVRVHIARIYKKCGVHSKEELAEVVDGM
jgi:hypothetical protein